MATTTILALLTLAHLVAFVGLAVYLVRARRQDAARLTALLDAMAGGHVTARPAVVPPVATVPPAPVSGVHAVPTGDADDDRRTVEIAAGVVWGGDCDAADRASVEELTTVHVPAAETAPVVEAPPSLLSASSKERLARLADGIVPVYRGQPTIGRYATRPRVADAPANVRRVKGGAT